MPLGSAIVARQSPGRQVVTDEQVSFSGGLNVISVEDELAPNQFRRGDNGHLTQYGAFVKRGGTQRTAGALNGTNSVSQGHPWYKSDGSTVTMAVCNGALYTTTYGAFPLTWTLRGANPTLSTSVTPSFATFVDASAVETVYIADGGLLNAYAGTTLTTNIAATPSVNVLCVHNQRLWGCGDPSYPDSIWYSALNSGSTLGVSASSGGQIVVRTFGSQNVVGLASLGASLMIVHEQGVSKLTGYGQNDIVAIPDGISRDTGTIAPRSLVVAENLLFFVSERGLYKADQTMVAAVGTPETPDPLTAILPLMTSANIALIHAVLKRSTNEILIFVPGYGVYVYHTILKAWSGPWVDGYLSPANTSLFETKSANGYPIILRGDASGFVSETDRSNIYLDNVVSDGTGGTTYSMALQCRRFYCEQPMLAKAWRFAYTLCTLNGSAASALAYSTDSDSGVQPFPVDTSYSWNGANTQWNTGTWNATGQSPLRSDLSGQGYYLDVTITDSGQAAPIIARVSVQGFLLGRRS